MDFSNHPLNQNNDNVSKTIKNNVNEKQVDMIAATLSEKLSNPGGRLFYCKVAWQLAEHKIWSNLEVALTGKDPKRYFSWLCKRELK